MKMVQQYHGSQPLLVLAVLLLPACPAFQVLPTRHPWASHSFSQFFRDRKGCCSSTTTVLFEASMDQKQVSSRMAKKNETSIVLSSQNSSNDNDNTNSDNTNSDSDSDLDLAITESPPLSFSKFLTMQGKRVIVTIRYSADAGLKPYFLTAAKKIKASHPDVFLDRRQTAAVDKEDPHDEPSFEILVDGKLVVGNTRSRSRKKIGNVQQSIFVSMQELDLAISRARRRRRPSTTVYGEVHGDTTALAASSLRLDVLRQQIGGGDVGGAIAIPSVRHTSSSSSSSSPSARRKKNTWKD